MIFTSALLCMTMLVLGPTQVVASAADGAGKKYISEVKVGMGLTSDQASKELLNEGFTILKDDSGNYADLNKDAGASSSMKEGPKQQVASKSPKYLAAGFSIVGAVLAAVSIYTTIEEMKAFYKVNFVPIPKYIVDKADITAKNAKGQEVMIKNQTAYYKAALCNRTAGSSSVEKKNYEILKDRNDLNGDVGSQWLSLYSVKYENGAPILADSLKLKMGNGDIPDGYTTGIHRFGEKNAFNLTGKLYCYNDPNNGTYVYFKNETSTVKELTAAGSTFSGGSLAIGAVAGLAPGAAITLLLSVSTRKRRENKAA